MVCFSWSESSHYWQGDKQHCIGRNCHNQLYWNTLMQTDNIRRVMEDLLKFVVWKKIFFMWMVGYWKEWKETAWPCMARNAVWKKYLKKNHQWLTVAYKKRQQQSLAWECIWLPVLTHYNNHIVQYFLQKKV